MAKLSISQLAAFTGRDRRTITARLVALDYTEGEDNGHFYESAEALAAIYCPDGENGKSLDTARRDLAVEQAALARVNREEKQKTRVPISLVLGLFDEVFQTIASTLKATKGKVLTEATINELLGVFRGLPARLKW